MLETSICFDSLPPQYSAHEGYLLLSCDEPIPGRIGNKLDSVYALVLRVEFALSLLQRVYPPPPFFVICEEVSPRVWEEASSLRRCDVFKQIDLSDHMHITHCAKKTEGLVLPQSGHRSDAIVEASTSTRHSSLSSSSRTDYLVSHMMQWHE